MLVWELLGTVLGAGIASGKEIAAFFACYGAWSPLGIVIAAFALMYLANNELPQSWSGRWQGHLWRLLLSTLLIVTGGAMLSGAGEIGALLLPVTGAYGIGMVFTFVTAWLLAHHTQTGLAWTSRVMLIVLAILIVNALGLPADHAAYAPERFVPMGIVRSVAYGGFNAALLLPVLQHCNVSSQRQRKRSILCAGMIFSALLLLGNSVLLRHPVLMGEPLPFIRLMQQGGSAGYYLGAVSLYLAILSTLIACLRGLGRNLCGAVCIGAVALLGFGGVVEVAYPAVGAACLCMLTAAKLMNCSRKAFQETRDMI